MLEIIAMTLEDAKTTEECGADRIELVSALTEGGLTPSYAIIESVVKSVKIPVNVMVRHHAKSFNYSNEEVDLMIRDIEIIKSLGANGIVLGLLDGQNQIEEQQLKQLLNVCNGLEVTFHKAIDETNVLESVQTLSKYPQITNILTAGGLNHITKNGDVIKQMIAKSGHINVLLGGGLTLDNFNLIKTETGATDFHFGTAVRINKSPFGEIDKQELLRLVNLAKK